MANNLFVSYDLHKPGQNYDAVIDEIKRHGGWAKVHYSLFYLDTQESAKQVAEAVRRAMDANDRLIVVDTTNNDAYWFNLNPEVGKFLQEHWNQSRFAA